MGDSRQVLTEWVKKMNFPSPQWCLLSSDPFAPSLLSNIEKWLTWLLHALFCPAEVGRAVSLALWRVGPRALVLRLNPPSTHPLKDKAGFSGSGKTVRKHLWSSVVRAEGTTEMVQPHSSFDRGGNGVPERCLSFPRVPRQACWWAYDWNFHFPPCPICSARSCVPNSWFMGSQEPSPGIKWVKRRSLTNGLGNKHGRAPTFQQHSTLNRLLVNSSNLNSFSGTLLTFICAPFHL